MRQSCTAAKAPLSRTPAPAAQVLEQSTVVGNAGRQVRHTAAVALKVAVPCFAQPQALYLHMAARRLQTTGIYTLFHATEAVVRLPRT